MDKLEYSVVGACREDAPFLAQTVMGALGEELCIERAGGKSDLPKVYDLFMNLGQAENSQYSYRNALIAHTPDGTAIGAIIFYDGALLHQLRRAFIRYANKILGWTITEKEMEEWGDETGPDQIYIDSLFVVPQYRGRGVASTLFENVFEVGKSSGKPFGLLVEPSNAMAIRLYEKLGFKYNGVSNFFQTPMLMMQLAAQQG